VEIEYILSDHQREQIEPLCERLRVMFPPWVASLSVRFDPDHDDPAQVHARPEYRSIGIAIGNAWFSEVPDEQAVHLIHELAHGFVAPLAQAHAGLLNALTDEDTPMRRWGEEALRIAEEGCVSDLSRVFAALLKQET
jgi:hypothetical protein